MSRRHKAQQARREHRAAAVKTAQSVIREARSSGVSQRCTPFIRSICEGWVFDERKANSRGYYMHKTMLVDISSSDAEEMFASHNWHNNRAFNNQHASSLADAIEEAPNIALAVGPDNHPWIVNGQHTVWAIFLRGQKTPANVVIYQCRDNQAVAALFSTFDSNMVRTQQQVLSAAMREGAIEATVSPNALAKWSSCSNIAEDNFHRKTERTTNSSKVQRARRQDVQDFASWMEKMYTPTLKKLVPAGVGACFYAMFMSDKIRGQAFIEAYLSGANLEEGSPVLHIRNKLINRPKGQHSSTVARMDAEYVYSAWKAFCLGRELSSLRPTRDLPIYNDWAVHCSPEMRAELLSAQNA